jgi:hypothetical protein
VTDRAQKIRQRVDSFGTVTWTGYTNRIFSAYRTLADECLAKCNDLTGCDIADPLSACEIASGDLAQARTDLQAAAGTSATATFQTNGIELMRDTQGDCYVRIQSGGVKQTLRIQAGQNYTFGGVVTTRIGTSAFSPSATFTPARVDGTSYVGPRLRTKYYNLSNLPN